MKGSHVKEDWMQLPEECFDTLTFGELELGDKFISLPIPGDNHGHGGLRGSHNLFTKTKMNLKSAGRGLKYRIPHGQATNGRGVKSGYHTKCLLSKSTLIKRDLEMQPHITRIFVSLCKGMQMIMMHDIPAIAGKGLFTDRYATDAGTYSGKRHNLRHVTLIHKSEIDEANRSVPVPFTTEDTRRNLLVEGDIDLQTLIGKEFSVGPVRMRGVEEYTPCNIPERMSGKIGFLKAFAHSQSPSNTEH